MTVEIPPLMDPLVEFILCARVPDDKTITSLGEKVAFFGGRPPQYAVQLVGNNERGPHLHLEIGIADVMKSLPRNSSKREIEKILGSLVGTEMDIHIKGGFLVRLADLPEQGIVRSTNVTLQVGPASLSMTGGQVDVTGGSVSSLSWSIDPEKKFAFMTIQTHRNKRLSDTYVTDEIDIMLKAWNRLVLGETDYVDNDTTAVAKEGVKAGSDQGRGGVSSRKKSK